MLWPPEVASQQARQPMVSIETRLVDVNLNTIERADNPGFICRINQLLRWDNVRAGEYIIRATGYSQLDGQGQQVAKADFPVVVTRDVYTEVPMTDGDPVQIVGISPNTNVEMHPGDTMPFIATAYNAQNIPLFVDPTDAFEWGVIDGGPHLQVSNDGRANVPEFADVPIVGRLFATHRDSGTTEELLIFITPRIIEGE
jgi:hypothetical protein